MADMVLANGDGPDRAGAGRLVAVVLVAVVLAAVRGAFLLVRLLDAGLRVPVARVPVVGLVRAVPDLPAVVVLDVAVVRAEEVERVRGAGAAEPLSYSAARSRGAAVARGARPDADALARGRAGLLLLPTMQSP